MLHSHQKKSKSIHISGLGDGKLQGTVQVPSSKSHSIRALLLAALAKGTSNIHNILLSGDTKSCLSVLNAWNVGYSIHNNTIEVKSPGLEHLSFYKSTASTGKSTNNTQHKEQNRAHNEAAPILVDIGNSGTTLYFATALASLGSRRVYFTGDSSIQKRSAKNLLLALKELGAKIELHNTKDTYCAPYSITGPIGLKHNKPNNNHLFIHCETSQHLSALLFALSFVDSNENTTIKATLECEHPYIDMTLEWLSRYTDARIEHKDYASFNIIPSHTIAPFNCNISGDYSSASFFICASALYQGELHIQGLKKDDVQADAKIIDVLQSMGASFMWKKEQAEWVLCKKEHTALRGIAYNLGKMPDALPVLAISACFANTKTSFRGVAHARIKETDRIAVLASELAQIGITTQEHNDGISIYPRKIIGGNVDSHGDHRIAMAFAIAALGSRDGIEIKNHQVATITYPNFYQTIEDVGAKLSVSS